MSKEQSRGVARFGREDSSHRGHVDGVDEVIIPDYVMHDFGFPEKTNGSGRRSGVAGHKGEMLGETP